MKRLLTIGIILATVIMLFDSCQKKFIIEPETEPVDSVSFAQQVIPIWETQSCTGCHNTNGQQPDLSAANAYNSISTMDLVLTNDPAASRIYSYPLANGNHYAKYTSAQASIILQWIEEGALDN